MEYFMLAVALAIGIVIGIVIGMYVRAIQNERKAARNVMGRLRIDHSEPDEPTRMFVELKGVTPDMIAQFRLVTFEVINESYLSNSRD